MACPMCRRFDEQAVLARLAVPDDGDEDRDKNHDEPDDHEQFDERKRPSNRRDGTGRAMLVEAIGVTHRGSSAESSPGDRAAASAESPASGNCTGCPVHAAYALTNQHAVSVKKGCPGASN